MRIGVFDVVANGHHASWIAPVVAGLRPVADVTLLVSESLAARLPAIDCELEVVGDETVDSRRQLDLLSEVARSGRIDSLLHLYGVKPVLREWLRRPTLGIPSAVVVTHASMLHYPSVYGVPLTLAERANAWYKERLVRRWRRRRDALAVFAMERPAVDRWARHRGAPAYFWPEPPVPPELAAGGEERRGCLFCGALAHDKNLQGLADALTLQPTGVELVIAGEPFPSYQEDLVREVERMRAVGVNVDLRARWHTTEEIMEALGRARCLVSPYLRQKGTSRTLLEAATAGTPVVAHKSGWLGQTVSRNGIGLAVDCSNRRALREAVLELTEDDRAVERFAPALADFADRHSQDRFASALRAPFSRAVASLH